MTKHKIAIVVGSLRQGSVNRRVAKSICSFASDMLDCTIVEIGDLPLYDEDQEGRHQAWSRFRTEIKAADAVLFVTPEYNRSVPGCLKNALDVGSRPYGHSAWSGKPGAVVSSSPGAMGGFGANHHLRQSLVFLNVPAMQQPEAYVGGVAGLFDEDGHLINEGTKGFLTQFMVAFANWVARLKAQG